MSTSYPCTAGQQETKKRKKKQNVVDKLVSIKETKKQKRHDHVTGPRGELDEAIEEEKTVQFDEMGLDARLIKAIADLGWKEPTLIQEKAIPLAINDRKDILGRGRTGCGKTGAYLIPIIHLILQAKKNNPSEGTKTRALVIAPSKELCRQIERHTMDLAKYCMDKLTALDVGSVQSSELKLLLSSSYDVIIGTPSRLLEQIKNNSLGNVNESLEFLVIDEADLIFSFGYEKEMKDLLGLIERQDGSERQSFLMSATLDTDVAALKQLCLKNPVSLRLAEPDLPESGRLNQYVIRCEEQEKYILLNALFKLNLIRGRTIIFTNGVDKCYRLKLFLEQFDVRACILNPELPIESRVHVVDEFNRGLYSIIIASDDRNTVNPNGKKGKKKGSFDREFGVSRGIDFQFVSNVINFDFPDSVTSYIHRVGRTGRGARDAATGTALSFVKVAENHRFELVKETLGSGAEFKPYQFKMDELDAFSYRSRDALKAVTSAAVREARVKEIKRQLLNSEKLKAFFEAHPKDYNLLRSDSELHPIRRQQHLRHMPDYMIPATLRAVARDGKSNQEVPLTLVPNQFKTKRKSKSNKTKQGNNPLRSFSLGFKGKK